MLMIRTNHAVDFSPLLREFGLVVNVLGAVVDKMLHLLFVMCPSSCRRMGLS